MSDDLKERINLVIKPEIIGKIEILVEKGLYTDYKDFFESAFENELNNYEDIFEEFEKKKTFVFGILHYNAKDLEKYAAKKQKLEIKVIGSLRFGSDVTKQLVQQTISKIYLAGSLTAPDTVLQSLNERRYTILGKSNDIAKRLKE